MNALSPRWHLVQYCPRSTLCRSARSGRFDPVSGPRLSRPCARARSRHPAGSWTRKLRGRPHLGEGENLALVPREGTLVDPLGITPQGRQRHAVLRAFLHEEEALAGTVFEGGDTGLPRLAPSNSRRARSASDSPVLGSTTLPSPNPFCTASRPAFLTAASRSASLALEFFAFSSSTACL